MEYIGFLGAAGTMPSLLSMAYLGAGILFILSLGGLSSQESARKGNWYGIWGMVIALAATMLHPNIGAMQFEGIALVDGGYSGAAYGLLLGTIAVGVVIGGVMAKRVQMTSMPELVALLHSFVGLAAVKAKHPATDP